MPANIIRDKVNAKHPDYVEYESQWNLCRLAMLGEDAVKKAGPEVLPMLAKQSSDEYKAYKMRALFYEASLRTLNGLSGALFHREPLLIPPNGDEGFFESLTPDSQDFNSYLRNLTHEVLTTGRAGILVDADSSGEVYPSLYNAESILNWKIDRFGGKEILTKLVLHEEETRYEAGSQFKMKKVDLYRVLYLDEMGIYQHQVYRPLEKGLDEFELLYEITPTERGTPMHEIPFFFIGCGGNAVTPSRPPLVGLVSVNFSHYRNSADLEHGRHFTGLPTVWVAGFKPDEGEQLAIGSQSAWVTRNTEAKVGFLEFTGQGLRALETAIDEKQKQMAILGARLLEPQKRQSESAENQRLQRSGENSILSDIAGSLSIATTLVTQKCAEWKGLPGFEDVKVEFQREFATFDIAPGTLSNLFNALQSGAISFSTWFYNLNRAGFIPEKTSQEEEEALIEQGSFGSPAAPMPTLDDEEPTTPGDRE